MKASNSTMMTGNKKTKKTKLGDDEDATKLDAKKKKKNLEPVEVPDQFDPEVLLDIKVDICVMCKGNHEVGLRLKEKIIVRSAEEEDPDEIKAVDPDSILDVNGVWASKYSILRKSQRMFVHYYCALNSPQAIFCGNRWSNLTKEVARGRSLICRYCGQGGATLGCLDNRCHVVMHVPCAVKLGFRRSGFKLSFLCEDHTKSYLEKELALDDQVRNDLSKGREPVPVTSVNHLDTALASKQVEYTKVLQHPLRVYLYVVLLRHPGVGLLEMVCAFLTNMQYPNACTGKFGLHGCGDERAERARHGLLPVRRAVRRRGPVRLSLAGPQLHVHRGPDPRSQEEGPRVQPAMRMLHQVRLPQVANASMFGIIAFMVARYLSISDAAPTGLWRRVQHID